MTIMANMTLRNMLYSLPKIIGLDIMADWISTIELSALDIAVTNHKIRPTFLSFLSHEYFSTYGIDSHFMRYKYLCWIFFRKVKVKTLKMANLMNSDVEMLNDLIGSYNRMHTFHVSNCFDVTGGILNDVILKVCRYHKSLKSLAFKNCPVVSEQHVIKLIESSPLLTSYDISCTNSLTCTSLLMLTACCSNVKELNIAKCGHLASSNGGNVLIQLAETYSNTMERLDLSSNVFINSSIVCSIVVKCTLLLSLNISHCAGIDDSTVLTIAACCRLIQQLGLRDCVEVTDVGISAIAVNCNDLTSLDISNCCNISSKSLQEIALHCIGLNCLYVSECSKVSDIVLINIAENCNDMLELNLTYCHRISDAAIMGLAKCCEMLRSIVLSFCYKVSDVSVITLADHCVHLCTVDFTCCEKITDGSIIYLVDECVSLTAIYVGGCVLLTDASLMAIAVRCCDYLHILDISDNANYSDIAVLKLVACCCSTKPSAFGYSSFYVKDGFTDDDFEADIRDSISSAQKHTGSGRLTTLIMSYCTGVSKEAINYISLTYSKLNFQATTARNGSRNRKYSITNEDYGPIEEYN